MTTLATEHLPEAGKYLTFVLDQERYSVPVLKVREIMRLCPITPVPRMPSYILGVINLRGKIVPVIDLRERFGLPKAVDLERACVVVVQFVTTEGNPQWMGMIVDIVEEVSVFTLQDLELPPDFGGDIDTRFITGMAKSKGSVKTLLDLDRLLNFVGPLDLQALVSSSDPQISHHSASLGAPTC
ncbi:chemotaxis protein CheW [Limnohabitans sp.]|uniref:chemotaxis protein CheW n=1 Tax=Limnohabitans sp. TaxID=1907725 RepID=UPI0025B944F2|nr:chemotaxis protein CheW [Limnohabitans sp.]